MSVEDPRTWRPQYKTKKKVEEAKVQSVTMPLCQAYGSHWSPRPDVLYLFKVDTGCNLCTAIVKEVEKEDASRREQANT